MHTGRCAARLVQRVLGVDLGAHLLCLGPVLAGTARQCKQLGRQQLETLGVAALRIDLEQLGPNGHALGGAAHRLLQDFFGLKVAAVGEVDIGFGDRIDVPDRVELAERIAHRRRRTTCVARVDALAAAGAEERVRLQAAFEERGLATVLLGALGEAIDAKACQQGDQATTDCEAQWVLIHQRGEHARLFNHRRRHGGP